MKKKLFSILLAAALTAAMLVGCGSSSSTPAEPETGATEESKEAAVSPERKIELTKIGVLSVLNITEEKYREMNTAMLNLAKQLFDVKEDVEVDPEVKFYDTLDAMQMGLEAGEINAMQIPKSTADYLIANNDRMEIYQRFGEIEELEEEEQRMLENMNRTGFAFMMREDSEKLRDEFDAVLDDLKADGTLNKITKEYITDVVEGAEPKAVAFEKQSGETIKVALTGDLPPMDYVAADGSFAGFNTAILAEMGKRMGKNIELKQVSSGARALSLASKEVDVVFWTRVGAGSAKEEDVELTEEQSLSEEDEAKSAEIDEALNEAISPEEKARMDRPEGTIVTDAYFVDIIVPVALKQ